MLNSLPPSTKLKLDSDIYSLLSNIDSSLSRLDGMLSLLSGDEQILSLVTSIEAFQSLLIDHYITGSNLSFSSVFEDEQKSGVVSCYLHSMLLGQKLIKDVSKSSHIIKTIHKEFFKENEKLKNNAGEYRDGKFDSGGKITPYPEKVYDLMEDLEKYLTHDFSYPLIVNIALVHAQFELIHPFSFGNGLVGRMLIPLHLYWKKMLSRPVFLISKTLSYKRLEYFDRLEDVSKNNNWESWIKFFLCSTLDSANKTIDTIKKIKGLETAEYKKILDVDFAAPALLKFFHFIFSKPIFTIQEITGSLNLTKQTANVVAAKLIELNIIEETTGHKRNRVFSHKKLIEVIDGSND